MNHLRIFFPLLVAVLLASCSHSSETTNAGSGGTSGPWSIPSVGTVYIYERLPSLGSSQLFDTTSVVKIGQNVAGKTNVIENYWPGSDTTYYCLDSNGDYSFGEHNPLPNSPISWATVPTESQQPVAYSPAIDSTYSNGNRFVFSDSIFFIGTETTTVPAGIFSTLHDREITIQDQIFLNNSGPTTMDTTYQDTWYALSTGTSVKIVDKGSYGSDSDQLFQYLPR